jgi:hypothetical protein
MHFDLSRTYQIFYHQDHIGVCLASDKGPSIGVVFCVKSMKLGSTKSEVRFGYRRLAECGEVSDCRSKTFEACQRPPIGETVKEPRGSKESTVAM